MYALGLLATAALLSASPAAPGEEAAVARVRRLYAQTNAAIAGARAQAQLLSEDAPGRPWKPLPLEAVCEGEVAPCAVVWRVDGKVVKVRLLDASGGGDWYHSVEYYLRADGSVAFRFEEHVTYACASSDEDAAGAPCRIERREWRDERGVVRREREARFMTVKGQERPLVSGVSLQPPPSTPHYARLAELPFAKQL